MAIAVVVTVIRNTLAMPVWCARQGAKTCYVATMAAEVAVAAV